MTSKGPSPKPAAVRDGENLGNAARNERQKAVLLREVNRTQREEIRAAIERGKQIVKESKKLCERTEPGPKSSKNAS